MEGKRSPISENVVVGGGEGERRSEEEDEYVFLLELWRSGVRIGGHERAEEVPLAMYLGI